MTTRVAIERLRIRELRNLSDVELSPSPRINVISGDNGQGKTSLLEAIYFVATSKSFRAERPREMLRHGAELAVVKATVVEDGIRREQRASLGRATRDFAIDGKPPETLARYAMRTPVVVFHPGDLGILSGPAAARRRLLDRIALFADPSSADHRARYLRAARSRAAALLERGVHAADLGPLEQIMAAEGAAVGAARKAAAERLVAALLPVFGAMAAPGLTLAAHFVPGGSLDPLELATEFEARRDRDARRGAATYGPHKDDLALELEGRPVRRHASQGQTRILTLAVKAAELECVRAVRNAEPVLLLDDVSSELDPDRTGAVYEFLHATPSQVFVTTTRPELFSVPRIAPSDRADFRLEKGALQTPV